MAETLSLAPSEAAPPELIPALQTARHHHAQGNLLQAAESYRLTLAGDPRNQNALLGLSLIARQTHQLLPALHMAKAALAANQNSALAWANCGDTLLALDERALAQSAFEQALILDPTLPAAHFGLGNLFAHAEDFPTALNHFQQAVRHAPHSPESHFALGFAHSGLGQHPQAIRSYLQALKLRPRLASAWLNLGVALIADGRDQFGAHCYRQALDSSTADHPAGLETRISAHLNLGHLARSRRCFEQAQQHYESALAAASCHRLAEIHVAFAYLHLEQRQFPQAWQSMRAARQADPNHQNREIPNARGILLLAEDTWMSQYAPQLQANQQPGRSYIDQAIQAFQEAESKGHKTAASNLGNALLRQGRIAEALASHHRAVELAPAHPGARYNLALTQLRAGDFARGWPNYEIRWQFREVHPRPRRFSQPRWQGEPLPPGASLLLYSEQGLGDTLQFLRYLPLVAQRSPDAHLHLEVQPPLVRLLASYPCAQTVLPHGHPLPHFTHRCPLLSLPFVFQTTLETLPSHAPYLHADPALMSERLQELNSQFPQIQPRIGLNWAGNPNYRADHERSTTPDTFLPLLEIPNIQWISLQKGVAAGQIREIPSNLQPYDASSSDLDLADTAAVMAHLDLVITTDTAIAHLAGALAKPLWLLLPWQSDWRWMQETLTTPWYPTARLFRQSRPGDWPELLHRVARQVPLEVRQSASDHGLVPPGQAPL